MIDNKNWTNGQKDLGKVLNTVAMSANYLTAATILDATTGAVGSTAVVTGIITDVITGGLLTTGLSAYGFYKLYKKIFK